MKFYKSLPVYILLSTLLTISIMVIGCKKEMRPATQISKEKVYPKPYTTPSCEYAFNHAGNNLSFKRSVLEVISGSLSFYPFFCYADSMQTTKYQSGDYTIYTFQDAVFSSNTIDIYFPYFNANHTGVYNIVSEEKLISGTLENNEVVIRGTGGFKTYGNPSFVQFDLYPNQGELTLGKDPFTQKTNFMICDANGTVMQNGYSYGAVFNTNLTIEN